METSICLIGLGIIIIFGSLLYDDFFGILFGITLFAAGMITLMASND